MNLKKTTLQWQKCIKNFLWCQLNSRLLNDSRLEICLGVESIKTSGVYIIWTGIDKRTILKVGSGIIKDRFEAYLRDPEVQTYKSTRLYVTWASTVSAYKPEDTQKGIEKFLGMILNPQLKGRLPDVDPIVVNLPLWDEPVPPL